MILEKIKELLADKIDVDTATITAQTKFSDLGIDSLDIVELLMGIEDEFNVEIEADESLVTIQDLINKIQELTK